MTAEELLSKVIEEEDLSCQPTEINRADVSGHCRSVGKKIQKITRLELLSEIDKWAGTVGLMTYSQVHEHLEKLRKREEEK